MNKVTALTSEAGGRVPRQPASGHHPPGGADAETLLAALGGIQPCGGTKLKHGITLILAISPGCFCF